MKWNCNLLQIKWLYAKAPDLYKLKLDVPSSSTILGAMKEYFLTVGQKLYIALLPKLPWVRISAPAFFRDSTDSLKDQTPLSYVIVSA